MTQTRSGLVHDPEAEGDRDQAIWKDCIDENPSVMSSQQPRGKQSRCQNNKELPGRR